MRAADLPGLGSVPARPDVRSYDDLVAYIAPTILCPTVLVAQSMGAYVALQLALRCPGAITHLVLVAATGGIDIASHGAADWRGDYALAFPTAAPWASGPVPDLAGRLSEISVPVLLIWATDDPWSPLSAAKALRGKFRSASLVTFASDDHWVAQSNNVETHADSVISRGLRRALRLIFHPLAAGMCHTPAR